MDAGHPRHRSETTPAGLRGTSEGCAARERDQRWYRKVSGNKGKGSCIVNIMENAGKKPGAPQPRPFLLPVPQRPHFHKRFALIALTTAMLRVIRVIK